MSEFPADASFVGRPLFAPFPLGLGPLGNLGGSAIVIPPVLVGESSFPFNVGISCSIARLSACSFWPPPLSSSHRRIPHMACRRLHFPHLEALHYSIRAMCEATTLAPYVFHRAIFGQSSACVFDDLLRLRCPMPIRRCPIGIPPSLLPSADSPFCIPRSISFNCLRNCLSFMTHGVDPPSHQILRGRCLLRRHSLLTPHPSGK